MNKNIRLISKILKWSIVIVSAVALAYLLYSYFVLGQFNFSSDSPLFEQLWQHAGASKTWLMLSTAPGGLLWFILVYWLFRLFSHFEKGEYFSLESMSCYLWLVWTHVALFTSKILFSLWLAYYHKQFFERDEFALGIDIGQLFTLLFMICIVHILKTAREFELENKEFI
jgi:hypothetical protein